MTQTLLYSGKKAGVSASAVELSKVSVRYAEQNALQQVSLCISPGEFVFIVGPSGAGKSTLLKLLYRAEKATEGKVLVNGTDVGTMKPRETPLLRRHVGMIFQDFSLLPDRTVYENVAFALRVTGASRRETHRRVPLALEMVGMAHRPDAFPHQISGGEQQRVAIARALAAQPSLLLADEPTGNLDPDTSLGILELLHFINSQGATVLIATHDVAIVDRQERRVLEFQAGKLVRDEACGRYGNTSAAEEE